MRLAHSKVYDKILKNNLIVLLIHLLINIDLLLSAFTTLSYILKSGYNE